MKRKCFLTMVCSFLLMTCMGMVLIACNSNDENPDVYNNSHPLPYSPCIEDKGDSLPEVKDVSGEVHHDAYYSIWYIADANGNRYYIYQKNEAEETNLNKILSEGLKVQFDGKVYSFDNEWTKQDEYFSKLPSSIKLYALVSPNYSIYYLKKVDGSEIIKP